MRTAAALLFVLCVGASALHLQEGRAQQGSYSTPLPQRHLQYIAKPPHGAGLSDRGWIFGHLRKLGMYHNATVHIPGGRKVSGWLRGHSKTVADDWDRYFDVDCEASPFNDMIDIPCVPWLGHDWKHMFDNGVTCLQIYHWYQYNDQELTCLDDFPVKWHLPASRAVVESATRISNSSMENGVLHIRRCDRMETNSICTDPKELLRIVAHFTNVKRWIIFHYSEPGYILNLKRTLNTLEGREFVSEDDIEWESDDNYFKFAVAEELLLHSSVSYDTHECRGNMGKLQTRSQRRDDKNENTMAAHVEESLSDNYLASFKRSGICGR